MDPKQRRRRVLMICAHEPAADPRITWAAESAAGLFDVVVLGLAADGGRETGVAATAGYRLVRLQRTSVGALWYLWHLKDVASGAKLYFLAAAIGLIAPALVVTERALALGGSMTRRIAPQQSVPSSARQPSKGSYVRRLVGSLRNSVLARVRFIFAVMRSQFAPAAEVFGRWLREQPEKPDVIHCNDLDTLLVGILAKRQFDCRVVYDAHEFYPVSQADGRWLDVTFFTGLERTLIREADAVVTVNPMLAEAMQTAYGLKHIYSVPNAERWVEGRHRSSTAGMMTRAARGRAKFLFQGRFAPGRGIEELINAWCLVRGDRAALFLRGPDNPWRQATIALARSLGLLDRSVFFLEPVSEDMLVTAAAEADVGVIPYKPDIINDRFSCPNKLSQYLHAGLMVLTNDLPYVRSVVEGAGAGLVYRSDDQSSLAAAVGRIVSEPELLLRCRQRALQYAEETFNWQAHAGVLHSLYCDNPGAACRSSGTGVPQHQAISPQARPT